MAKRFKWFTIFRYLGILMFIIVIARTNLRDLWGWLKNVDGWMLLIALVLQLVMLFIKSSRWLLMNEKRPNFGNLFQRFGEFQEAYALGVVTPGRMGELLKAGHASGRTGVVSSGLLVIAERGFDLSIFFFMAGISLVMGYLSVLSPSVGYVLTSIAVIGMVITFSILVFPVVVKWVEWLMKRIRIIPRDQYLVYVKRSPGSLAIFLTLSFLSNMTAFFSFYFTALAVHLSIGFMATSGSVALAGVINTIPVTVMGIGTRDVTLLYVLRDLPRAQVIAFSGLILLVFQIFGGVLALVGGQVFLQLAKKKDH